MSEHCPPGLIETLEAQAIHAGAVLHALMTRFGPLFSKLPPLSLKLPRDKTAELVQDGFSIESVGQHPGTYTLTGANEKSEKHAVDGSRDRKQTSPASINAPLFQPTMAGQDEKSGMRGVKHPTWAEGTSGEVRSVPS